MIQHPMVDLSESLHKITKKMVAALTQFEKELEIPEKYRMPIAPFRKAMEELQSDIKDLIKEHSAKAN